MKYGYLCLGIGVAIVIIGIFVIFKLETNPVSIPNTISQQNSTLLKENFGILSGGVSINADIVCKWDTCFGGNLSAGHEVDVYSTNGTKRINQTMSDSQGRYSIQLPAGKYILFNNCADNGLTTNRIKIVAGQTTIFNISCHITH